MCAEVPLNNIAPEVRTMVEKMLAGIPLGPDPEGPGAPTCRQEIADAAREVAESFDDRSHRVCDWIAEAFTRFAEKLEESP